MRVVIADDSGPYRQQAEKIFRQLGWDIISVCSDGEKAWGVIEQEVPDLAWLDYSMPNMTGAEVAKLIFENDLPTRVILVTANGQGGSAYNPDLHASSVVIKPFGKGEAHRHLAKVFGYYNVDA